MTAQEKRVVGPYVQQNASTMAFSLRNFTWMLPPMFYESKVNEDPKDFHHEVYKILYAIGESLNETVELVSY